MFSPKMERDNCINLNNNFPNTPSVLSVSCLHLDLLRKSKILASSDDRFCVLEMDLDFPATETTALAVVKKCVKI